MVVDEIVSLGKTRYQVVIESKPAFVLYKRELARWNIRAGFELNPKDLEEIKAEILVKRAKKRALHLLEKMNRTESNLHQKLREGFYPLDVIESCLVDLKSYGYIDDTRYADVFVSSRAHKKSKRELVAQLRQKGIDRNTIATTLDKFYQEHSEEEAIQQIIAKRRYDPATSTPIEKNKLYSYLARKGFSYDAIQRSFSSISLL